MFERAAVLDEIVGNVEPAAEVVSDCEPEEMPLHVRHNSRDSIADSGDSATRVSG